MSDLKKDGKGFGGLHGITPSASVTPDEHVASAEAEFGSNACPTDEGSEGIGTASGSVGSSQVEAAAPSSQTQSPKFGPAAMALVAVLSCAVGYGASSLKQSRDAVTSFLSEDATEDAAQAAAEAQAAADAAAAAGDAAAAAAAAAAADTAALAADAAASAVDASGSGGPHGNYDSSSSIADLAEAAAVDVGIVRISSVRLGSVVGPNLSVTMAKSVFAPMDTIYAEVSTTTSHGQVAGVLHAHWSHISSSQTVHQESKAILFDGLGRTLFQISKPDGWPSGLYMIEVRTDQGAPVSQIFTVQ